MNIQIALGYVKHGYRIRRPNWYKCEYLCNSHNEVVMRMTSVMHPRYIDLQKFEWVPRLWDLTADDWELILDGIVDDTGTVKYKDEQ